MLYFYAHNWMGGGGIKILTVGFLWIGLDCALVFAVLMMIFATLYIVAVKFEWVRSIRSANISALSFAPSGGRGADRLLHAGVPPFGESH
jgi:Flp pilus assembly protein protease CpaA